MKNLATSLFDLGLLVFDAIYCEIARFSYSSLGIFKISQFDKRMICLFDLQFYLRLRSSDSIILIQNLILQPLIGKEIKFAPRMTIIDIGAHIGAFSLYAACKTHDGRIISFEPAIENFNLLKQNIKLNKKINYISPFNLAVSSIKGRQQLHIDKLFPSANSIFDVISFSENSETVQSTTLKEIFQKNNIKTCDLLKLDCEGAEKDILTQCPPEILNKINQIFFEFHFGKKDLMKLTSFLQNNGFKVKILTDNFFISRLSSLPLVYAFR